MAAVSAVLIVYNEEEKIGACLDAVTWVDEILVVDVGSTDNTVAIAEEHGARIIRQAWVPYGDPLRNFAVEEARGPWVLLLDADEIVTPELAASLQSVVRDDWPVDVVTIERHNIIYGRLLAHREAVFTQAIERIPRLFRRGVLHWPSEIHQVADLDGLRVRHLEGETAGVLRHLARDRVDDAISRFARFTGPEAAERLSRHEAYSTRDALTGALRQFMSVYFKQQACRDGIPGLFFALESGMYRLLIWMHMWEKEGRKPQHDAEATLWGCRVNKIVEGGMTMGRLLARAGRLIRAASRVRRQQRRRMVYDEGL